LSKTLNMDNGVLDNEFNTTDKSKNIRYAGFGIRLLASIIDTLALSPILILNFYNLINLKSIPFEIAITLTLIIYKPLMEYLYGATVGKMALKIKVVTTYFDKLSLSQAAIRYTPWLIGNIVSIYGTIMLYKNPDFLSATDFWRLAKVQESMQSGAIDHLGTVLLIVSAIVILFNEKRQGLHDNLANTYCIHREQ